MTIRIRASVVEEVGAPFTPTDLEIDDPGPGEILVRVVASGVCHTDANTRGGDMPMPLPGVLGHEGAGVVEAVGPGVTSPRPGDHVVLGWPSCGECRNCREGEPRYCLSIAPALVAGVRLTGEKAGTSGYRRLDGTPVSGHFFGQSSFATHALALAGQAVVIPRDVPLDIAGPLACGIATGAGAVLNTARPRAGDSIVVYGAGAVGLAAVMAARNTPATTIVAVDVHDSRLALASRYGATHVVNASATPDTVATVREIIGGSADFALDCTGVIPVVEQAVETVGMLGTAILIGGAPAGAAFRADHFRTLFGKRIVGTLGGSGDSQRLVPALLALWRQGRFPFDELVDTFDFEDIEGALEASRRGDVIKPVVRMPDPAAP
ncbi:MULTISPECIES: NAD(P)-dependent alcohol dehydrogenase [unclassified Streptomyces]|uniref:NAD(P)-dependent alcohol dehydrogenase n=1 Tax=unclassified Streptomyces TaxID=2593676 RepID=UPI001369BD8F|nr:MULTISPECIES: NAD(P)-dependent alcohol dehydrogenase [unclassified Streptomyces]MYU24735.1 alcohol dehydrogenase catalytic domain-containing protein [Streptomyces sp. SID8352]